MKFLLIISSLLTIAFAQEVEPSLSCVYQTYGGTYVCDLTINNPDGLNNFTEIGGNHLEGFTNTDVNYVVRYFGVTANVPSIICGTFPNVARFELDNTGIIEVDDSAFSGCSGVTDIYLEVNSISSISPNAFVNLLDLRLLLLDNNLLTTLPENVFANQENLVELWMNNNPFEDIPVDLFQPLENLQILHLGYTNLAAVNNQWFASNTRLGELNLEGNRIDASPDNFIGMESVVNLNLAHNGITEVQAGAFSQLPILQDLFLFGNNLTVLQADSFLDLGQLAHLDISQNPIETIQDGAFRGLRSVTSLDISASGVRQLSSNSFEGLENLSYIDLNYNELEELPPDVFVPLPNINYIDLWSNRLKTVRRNSFGALTNLRTLDLEGNIVNALDRSIIDDAVNLDTLYFHRNLCASNYFGNFQSNRDQFLMILERCFVNFRYIVETTTEGDVEFSFFEGPHPGIAMRVNTDNEIQIALTPFNFLWTPMIEIFIGTANNTRSIIRVNQDTDVVIVPTPNIIAVHQSNDFRVTWENQVILVYRGNANFPFMGYTMQDFFNVNFYGLKAVDTPASWIVQPFQFQ